MTEHTDTNEFVPCNIDRRLAELCMKDDECVCGAYFKGELRAAERIAAWLDGFNHQQWRPAYATTTQEASRQFADAIRRGDWKQVTT